MPAEFTGDPRTNDAVGIARAHSGSADEIGTHHLLIGLAIARSSARELLDAAELTHRSLVAVQRSRPDLWERPDGTQGTAGEVAFTDIGKTERVTGAAGLALSRYLADARQEPETLLTYILSDDDSHAVAMTRECGADVALLRDAAATRRAPQARERVPAELGAMRDKLLGRARYRNPGLRNLSLAIAVAARPNWAQTPVMWAKLEAEERARRRGGKPGTDDLLIALLAAHEVASTYPHLLAEADPGQYDGARALAGAGLDSARLTSAAAAHDLGADAVTPKTLLRPGPGWPADTAALLRRLLAHDDNRAVRLLRALEVDLSVTGPLGFATSA